MKKGANFAVTGMGLLLISVILLIFAQKATGEVFSDKRAETEVAAMGIRNTMLHATLTENSKAIYSMPKNDEYVVELDPELISVHYGGITTPEYSPKISMRHYLSNTVANKITASEICIVNRKDASEGCKPVIEICRPDETCCSSALQNTVC